jgi:hypothetical protein
VDVSEEFDNVDENKRIAPAGTKAGENYCGIRQRRSDENRLSIFGLGRAVTLDTKPK